MPMNSAAPRRWRMRSLLSWSRPSPESTMKRMPCTVVSAVISVLQGRAQVTETPSFTRRAAAARLAGVMRLMVPSSSSLPQRPQLDRVRMYSRTCASVGGVATGALLELAGIDLHHRAEELEGARLRALEGVPPDDGAEPAAVPDGAVLVVERLLAFVGGAPREDDDTSLVEGGLHDVADTLGQGGDGHRRLLVGLLGLPMLDVLGRRLDLDDVRSQLGADLGRVGDHIDARLPRLADGRTPRVRPDHGGKAVSLALRDHLAALLVHGLGVGGAGIDGEAGGHAAQPERVLHRARDGRERILLVIEHVVVVHLEDKRDVAGELRGARLEEAQGRGVGVAARVDGELEVIGRIVARRIDGEAPRGAVLEALVHGQDDEPPRAGQTPMVHDAGQIGAGTRIVPVVPREDLLHARSHGSAPFRPNVIDDRSLRRGSRRRGCPRGSTRAGDSRSP